MRIMPYRTVDNVIDGVVVTFFYISELKKAKKALEDSQQILEKKIEERTAGLKEANKSLMHEINERKNSEADLRRLAAVVKDSNDSITVQDLDGKIIAWNRGSEKMYGWSETEALNMNVRELIPKEKHKEFMSLIKNINKEDIPSFETQRITKDGRCLDVWLVVTKLVDEKGRITSIATTERNITGRGKI